MNTLNVIYNNTTTGSSETSSPQTTTETMDTNIAKIAIIGNSSTTVVDQEINFDGDNVYRGTFILSGNKEINELSGDINTLTEYVSSMLDLTNELHQDVIDNQNDIYLISSETNYINDDFDQILTDLESLESESEAISSSISTLSSELSTKIDESDEGYTVNIPLTGINRVFDNETTTVDDLYYIIGTLLKDLKTKHII